MSKLPGWEHATTLWRVLTASARKLQQRAQQNPDLWALTFCMAVIAACLVSLCLGFALLVWSWQTTRP